MITSRRAYGLMGVFLVVALNVIAVYYVRTHDIWRAILATVWVIGIALGTNQALHDLAHSPPQAEQIALRLALLQPMIGMVPVILLLLP